MFAQRQETGERSRRESDSESALKHSSWAARSWIRARLQQAGNVTSTFQHIKPGLVHPWKNHVGTDVDIYASKTYKTHTRTHFSTPFFFFFFASHSRNPHQIPICRGGEPYHYNQQRSEESVIFRRPESYPHVLFSCPLDSLHHAERLGCVELGPLTPMRL